MTLPNFMTAAVLTGHGGLEKLIVRDNIPVPEPKTNEVLIKVGACGMNNTDINTRIGWYSKSVSSATGSTGGSDGLERLSEEDATWGGDAVVFPLIQGADVVGRIVAVGNDVSSERVGERVLVDPWMRDPSDPGNFQSTTSKKPKKRFWLKNTLEILWSYRVREM
jgi:NADPH:quinone reductase-like Zn-dependent oxidoreductase